MLFVYSPLRNVEHETFNNRGPFVLVVVINFHLSLSPSLYLVIRESSNELSIFDIIIIIIIPLLFSFPVFSMLLTVSSPITNNLTFINPESSFFTKFNVEKSFRPQVSFNQNQKLRKHTTLEMSRFCVHSQHSILISSFVFLLIFLVFLGSFDCSFSFCPPILHQNARSISIID